VLSVQTADLPALQPAICNSRFWAGAAASAALAFSAAAAEPTELAPVQRLYIREYRVIGARELPPVEVQDVVYPFLGPGRTTDDVEAARSALEKAYHDKGYQAAAVLVPEQHGRNGVIFLQVTEGRVAELRVKGSRYFLPSAIKRQAQSLAEGRALNFNDVSRDIVGLNQLADRQITPTVRPGEEPGTVDVDLTVKDKLPLHGSVELNNRYSADTTALRLDTSLSYNNLWQLGHSVGASVQVSPEALEQVKVFTGYYIWRFPGVDWFSLLLQGTKSDSNVNTLGSLAVVGKGETLGARAIFTLPPLRDFYHSLSVGFDYKRTEQITAPLGLSATAVSAPKVSYFPVTASYNATWAPKGSVTELNAAVTLGLRGVGNRTDNDFDAIRYRADANFVTLRGDLSHTHELGRGFQAYAKVQGQISDQPLLNTEQMAGGGLGTVRGYLEAEALGDNAVFGTLELRSPTLLSWLPGKGHEWRLYAFVDRGRLTLHSPLPEQDSIFTLASYGIGSRLQFWDFLNGSIDVAVPTVGEGRTKAGEPFIHFRVWADF
jgi:hemolysin activation/secretion protein